MKQIYSNIKKGEIKIKTESLDDLWYLSTIIDKGDLIKGKTLRKIKIGEKDQRAQKISKKPVFLSVEAEKVEYNSDALRISGKIKEGPDDIQLGSYHTFNIEPNSIITIIKERWLKFQLERLEEAFRLKTGNILICVLDREEAFIALLKKYDYEILAHLKGDVEKKFSQEKVKNTFYRDIIQKLEEYNSRYKLNQIIIASPAFWKEELMKEMQDKELKSRIVSATCSSVDKNGINEVLKRPETKHALKQDRFAREINLVENLFIEISKDGAAAYGLKDIENAIGAIKSLLITDKFILKMREEGRYDKIESMLKTVESTKGEIHIISSEHDGGRRLDGIGGIGAELRYKLNY